MDSIIFRTVRCESDILKPTDGEPHGILDRGVHTDNNQPFLERYRHCVTYLVQIFVGAMILGLSFAGLYESSLSKGLLPKWLFFVAVMSIWNSFQSYTTLKYAERVYGGEGLPARDAKTSSSSSNGSVAEDKTRKPSIQPQVTPLSARTFGTWTFLSSVIRVYAALNISDPICYQLAVWTYVIAFGHFAGEWLVFRTAKWGPALAAPVFVSTGSLIWMTLAWKTYVP